MSMHEDDIIPLIWLVVMMAVLAIVDGMLDDKAIAEAKAHANEVIHTTTNRGVQQ